ncbi:hypothetical protein EON63_12370 [archaeon]|nr:MAG: hypothetical protein EON63_12370 [archaeon]
MGGSVVENVIYIHTELSIQAALDYQQNFPIWGSVLQFTIEVCSRKHTSSNAQFALIDTSNKNECDR